VELLELIKVHAYEMTRQHQRVIPISDAARDFYDHIYLPTVETINSENLGAAFPQSTEADLFMFIYERRRALFPDHGSMDLEEVVKKTGDEAQQSGRRKSPKKSTKKATNSGTV